VSSSGERQDILLEAGTNELEVLVFSLGRTRYGVNVAKVREVVGRVKTIHTPQMHPAVVGMFKLRESVMPLVDLQAYFRPGTCLDEKIGQVIFMEFNNLRVGFRVEDIDRIYRVSWEKIRPMPPMHTGADSVITSVCHIDERLVLMVDFEKIAMDIGGREYADHQIKEPGAGLDRSAYHVLLAEDSAAIREALRSTLLEAGYTRLWVTTDGARAWSALEESLQGDADQRFDVVVTDIEMPRMDGLHLCKRIKDHPGLASTPVLIFSSLVSDTNLKKCQAVGADAAITKPHLDRVSEILDEFIATRCGVSGQTSAELATASV